MTIYSKIKPTVLMVKKHQNTGLLYFCKTTRIEKAVAYKGSGVRWKTHLKKYGNNIVTLWVSDVYYDTSIRDVALNFSRVHNIIESKLWANLVEEDGLYGGSTKWSDEKRRLHIDKGTYRKSEEMKRKLSLSRGGRHEERWKSKQPGPGKGKYLKTDTHKMNIKKSLTKLTDEQLHYLQIHFTNKRGEKASLSKEWGCSIDQITRWVGKSFTHNKEFI
jgi:hypothetical protein